MKRLKRDIGRLRQVEETERGIGRLEETLEYLD